MKYIFILLVSAGLVSSCDLGRFETVRVTPYFSIFYNAEFAKRFSLPQNKAVNFENQQLKAIAIGIQESNDTYECNIHLYYDSAIKLYSPNGQQTYIGKQAQETFFSQKMNDIDYRYYDAQLAENAGRAYFRSKSLKTMNTGTSSTVAYSSYKQAFLPGLSLASFKIGCPFLDAKHGEAELWVQKAGLGDYRLIDENPLDIKHTENNYRFDVPLALLLSVQEMIDKTTKTASGKAGVTGFIQYGPK